MIGRTLLFSLLLPLSALAQLEVFQFNGTIDTPVAALVNVGTAAPGDTLETRFHVRNIGSGPASLTNLTLSGQGFTIVSAPSLPYILAPYVGLVSEAEIDVDFNPPGTGSFSAFLNVNSINLVLQGISAAAAALTLSGSQTPLSAGAVVNFGSVAVGATQTQGFALSNFASSSITVASVAVSGSAFSGPIGLKTPVEIGPGQSVAFQIKFAPQSGTSSEGALTIDNRAFTLSGQGLDAPLPGASIVFASSVGASAQQDSITIPLASASQVTGSGTLTMAFQSGVAGVADDAAIQFLSGPFRNATVSVAIGATSATIGGKSSMAFQTGTTAGTITFTLTLNKATQQLSLTIPASPIILDSATAIRQLGALGVAFSGFDNTYSASQLAFTFYDLKGTALPQGVIDVDARTPFQQYFSAAQAGGAFALLATFPVTGDTTQIGFVTAQVTNSMGATTTQQITIAN
jgi:Abnormal spindle-like microcephaly-assoc'd, ASPM-SPD-2-Hydin